MARRGGAAVGLVCKSNRRYPVTDIGTMRVKSGLADMLKGGVIMDVTNAEQAKIAEDAGYKTSVFCPLQSWKQKGLPTAPGVMKKP